MTVDQRQNLRKHFTTAAPDNSKGQNLLQDMPLSSLIRTELEPVEQWILRTLTKQ
jgi:hypothetical protein